MKIIYFVIIGTVLVCCRHRPVASMSINVDSVKSNKTKSIEIRDGLYDSLNVLPSVDYTGFTYRVEFNASKSLIVVTSEKKIENHKVDYVIEYFDSKNLFDRLSFTTANPDFSYVRSFFLVDNLIIDLTNVGIENSKNTKVLPALIWYDRDFGVSTKYYELNKMDIFLIRGLDLYCNGRGCTTNQLFVIQKNKNNARVSVFKYSDVYPYTFEDLKLFISNGDSVPKLFVPKEGIIEVKSIRDLVTKKLESI